MIDGCKQCVTCHQLSALNYNVVKSQSHGNYVAIYTLCLQQEEVVMDKWVRHRTFSRGLGSESSVKQKVKNKVLVLDIVDLLFSVFSCIWFGFHTKTT